MRTVYQIDSVPACGVRITIEGKLLRLLFDFEKVEISGEDAPKADDLYYCEGVDVEGSGYGDIISAIVNDKYPVNEKDAIMANYELVKDGACSEEKSAEYLQEYKDLQAWRAHAKEIAHTVISELENM